MIPNYELTSSVTTITFKSSIREQKAIPSSLFRHNEIVTSNSINNHEHNNSNESLTDIAMELEKLLSVDDLKLLIKQRNIPYVEVRASSFRINKKIGKGIKPIRYTLNEPFSLQGLLNVEAKVNEIKEMSKSELIEYKTSISKVTVEQVVSVYNDFENKGYEHETLRDYGHKCNTINNNFGGLHLKNLTHDVIKKWALGSYLSVGVIYKVLQHLEKVIELAERQKQMKFINHQRIDFKEIKASVKQKKLVTVTKKTKLSEQEVRQVELLDLESVKSEGLYPIWLAFQIHVRNDGRRSGEMRCSAVDDITFYKDQLKIKLSRACTIRGYKTTKIAKGVSHSIDIYEHTYETLTQLINDAKQYEPKEIEVYEKGVLVKREKIQFLLINPKTGKPYTEIQFRNDMKRLQLLAGIKEPISPRYLRHTVASLAKEAGASDDVIAKQMTHCNDSTTKKYYLQIVHQDTTEEAKDFEQKLAKQMKNDGSISYIKRWGYKVMNLTPFIYNNRKKMSRLKSQLSHFV